MDRLAGKAKASAYDADDIRRAVYDVVRLIPAGRATSYGAVARAVGHPTRSRMVGRIMGGCGVEGVPAHRVVSSQGGLSGRHAFADPDEMQRKLEAEGVSVFNHRIRNWKAVFWDPLTADL